MSVVSDLNDNCFAVAGAGLGDLYEAFEEEVGRPPEPAEVAEILTWALRSMDPRVGAGRLELKGLPRKRTRKLESGDLYGIVDGSRLRVVVCLGSFGRFGWAFGLCRGQYRSLDLEEDWRPSSVVRHPVFVGPEGAATGRWIFLGRREGLEALFAAPEIYHLPQDHPGEPMYGEHGLAEAPDGTLRQLDAAEAAELGLPEGRYRSAYMVEEFEALVKSGALDDDAPGG